MPYIKPENREKFENDIVNIAKNVSNAGDINYVFTSILQEYLKKVGVRYANINEIIGALECTKLEFYRRIAHDYENQCIERNGDVMRVDVPKPKSII